MSLVSYLEESKLIEIAPHVSIGFKHRDQLTLFEEDSELMFDIASLTKVVNTYFLTKLLIEREISLTTKINQFIRCDLDITIQDLLTHTSGLHDLRLDSYSLQSVLDNCESSDNQSINYADINFILIYYIFVELVGDVQTYIENQLTELGIERMFYLPKQRDEVNKYVESELKEGRNCFGEVHDSKAYLMGGVSSHAGLFATTNAVLQFGQIILNDSEFATLCFDARNIKRSSVEIRTLGFEIKDKFKQFPYNGHQLFHTGFTGCSLLVDYKNQAVVVLLSNYLMYGRKPDLIREFRNRVHSQIYTELSQCDE